MRISAHLATIAFTLLLIATPSTILAEATYQPGSLNKNSMMTSNKSTMNVQTRVRTTKIKPVVDLLLEKYTIRLDKYEDFLTRVSSRRDKLAGEGKNVARIDTFLVTAGDNLRKTRTLLAVIKVKLEAIDYDQEKQIVRTKILPEFRKLHETMTNLHNSMSQTVMKLKEINAIKPTKTVGG